MEVQGNEQQYGGTERSDGREDRQQGEMAEMRNARGGNGFGLREGLKEGGGLGGIPGLRIETGGTCGGRGPGPFFRG